MENKSKLIIKTKALKNETAVLSARLPLDLIQKVDKVAEETGRTRNEIIQLCLEFSLDNLEIDKN